MSSRDLAEAYLLNWVTISSHPSQKTIEHFFGGEMFILAYLARSGDASPTELAGFSVQRPRTWQRPCGIWRQRAR